MRWKEFGDSSFKGINAIQDFLGFGNDAERRCEKIHGKLRIPERTVLPARIGLPEPDDMRPTAIERDIDSIHRREIDQRHRYANAELRRARAGLDAKARDITESEIERIRASHKAALAEELTQAAAELPGRAAEKVDADSALAGFRVLNMAHDVPITRSALEWFATTLGTAIIEAFVNTRLFKGEYGYVDAFGFTLAIGGAIALIGVAAGIGWAQLRRPKPARKLGGVALFAAAFGLLLFLILGMIHYRDALVAQSADAAAQAQMTLAAAPLAPLADASLLPYVIFNLAGFALVCWKSVSMWGYLDLKRLERATAQARRKFEHAKERARLRCDAARRHAFDLLDEMLKLAEGNVEDGNEIVALCQDIRDAFKVAASAFVAAALACHEEYRNLIEMVHPSPVRLARFAEPPKPIEFAEILPDEVETTTRAAIVARLAKVREAMPGLTAEIGTATDAAIARVGEMAAQAENDRRRNPRGKTDNVVSFG